MGATAYLGATLYGTMRQFRNSSVRKFS